MRRSNDGGQPPWVTLFFRKFSIDLTKSALTPYETGLQVILGNEPPIERGPASGQSWILAETLDVTFTDEPPAANRSEVLTRAFERCLSAINLLSETSRIMTGEVWSRPLSKDSLDPLITYFAVSPSGHVISSAMQMRLNNRLINTDLVVNDEDLTAEQIRQSIDRRLSSNAAATPHPFLTSRSLALQAQSQRLHGESQSCIVSLQASVESLLRSICRMLHVDSGSTPEKIAEKAQVPFASLLKTELPGLLKGNWLKADSAPQEYIEKLYKLRNRIVHSGYSPTYSEINPAFAARERFIAFIEGQLKSSWRKYPVTMLAWHDKLSGGPDKIPTAARSTLDDIRREKQYYWA